VKYHVLKTWPDYFQRILEGRKTAEWRKNDRNFCHGDYLVLQEYKPKEDIYTGRVLVAEITDIVQAESFHMTPGYCVMSICLISEAHNIQQTPGP